jgi:hypothetical protein
MILLPIPPKVHNWDYRQVPPCPASLLSCSLFLPGLASNFHPLNLCLLGSWDYKCEPLCSPLFSLLSHAHTHTTTTHTPHTHTTHALTRIKGSSHLGKIWNEVIIDNYAGSGRNSFVWGWERWVVSRNPPVDFLFTGYSLSVILLPTV